MEDQQAGTAGENYTMGYGKFVEVLKKRSLETHGGFFMPHLQSGMSVIDCGCGPGTITFDLAGKVAPGEVVGVDIEESQVELAAGLAKDRGVANVRFEVADLYDLPYPAGSFDRAFVHNVLFHLGDPIKALGGIRRVLRKGGIVGMSHSASGAGLIAYPPAEHIERDTRNFARLVEHNGGSPGVGAKQGALLCEAGFSRVEMAARYFSEGTAEAVGAYAAMRAGRLAPGEDLAEKLVAAGIATRAELVEISNEWKAWGGRSGAFIAAPVVTALGWK